MRILLTIAELARGGAERVTLQLAAGLADRGHEVTLAAGAGPLDDEAAGLRIERVVLPRPTGGIAAVARNGATLRRAVAAARPDVIHAHNVRATATALLARRLPGPGRPPRVVSTFHAVPPEQEARAVKVLRRSDAVACVSHNLAEQLARAGLPDVAVIRNAIDLPPPLSAITARELDAELGLAGRPVVTIVGRLVAQKAHHRFLAAAAIVAERVPDAIFLIVGTGPLEQDIRHRTEELGLEGSVVITGLRPDARALIGRSDLLVFSSDWEGLSIAALEALSASVPVVSTDVAGMREVLATGAGVVVPHDADPLADAITDLLGDPTRRAAMGAAGRTLVEREFSLDQMLDGYLRLYG